MWSQLLVVGCSLMLTASSTPPAGNTVPWERQYKIKPNETQRMTPADVLGPDGIIYPNWTRCGVQVEDPAFRGRSGIPQVKPVNSIEDFGGKANDNADDSNALAQACEAAGKKGGGAVLLGDGTYYLDRPVTVRHDNVVIRGNGPGKTRLIFRYAVPDNSAAFYSPSAGSRVGRDTRIEMHCKPTGLAKMTILIDDKVVGEWKQSQHSGNTFNFALYGRDAIGKVPDGPHVLKGVAEYSNGSKLSGEIRRRP